MEKKSGKTEISHPDQTRVQPTKALSPGQSGKESAGQVQPGQKLGLFASVLSLIALGGVACLGGYLYYNDQKLTQLEQAVVRDQKDTDLLINQAKKTFADLSALQKGNIESQENLKELKTDIEQAQNRFSTLVGHSSWVMNEVDYLVKSADISLRVNQDIKTAIQQLELADQKLKALAHPELNWVRSAIREDITRLQAYPIVDKEGVWSRLTAIQAQFSDLIFRTIEAPIETDKENKAGKALEPKTDSFSVKEALEKSWDELKSLIRVTRYDNEVIQPMLTHYEDLQLRRTLDLMVEQTKWAVLKNEPEVYRESLNRLKMALRQYFEPTAMEQNLMQRLEELDEIPIQAQTPEITHSIQAIQQVLVSPLAGQTQEEGPAEQSKDERAP